MISQQTVILKLINVGVKLEGSPINEWKVYYMIVMRHVSEMTSNFISYNRMDNGLR